MPAKDMLSIEKLERLLAQNTAAVEDVLSTIYNGAPCPHTLDTLKIAARTTGQPVAQELRNALDHDGTGAQFLGGLRSRKVPGFEPDGAALITSSHNTAPALSGFFNRLGASACRILIGRHAHALDHRGSGLLISRRLVLTAAHVITDVLQANARESGPHPLRVWVRAADGRDYPARVVWHLPPHEREVAGGLVDDPDEDTYRGFPDVALLRSYKPLGLQHNLGHIDPDSDALLSEENLTELAAGGQRTLYSLHFPEGRDVGVTSGLYDRPAAAPGQDADDGAENLDMYLPYAISTRDGSRIDASPGSSGAAVFDASLTYLGHHQGQMGEFSRMVPYARYRDNPDFRTLRQSDTGPGYIWSMDESIDGHLIIGRAAFFNAVSAILDRSARGLKGIWVRRLDTEETTGLTFTFDILRAFLKARSAAADTERISADLHTDDLLAEVEAQVFGIEAAAPQTGEPRRGQRSLAASDKDRARALAAALAGRAQAAERDIWFFFDNPPSGLSRVAQVQLEHLVAELLTQPRLYVILSGYETFSLADRLFETVFEAADHGPPGLFVEFVGQYRREDLSQTIAEMNRELALGWPEPVISHVTSFTLSDVQGRGHVYPAATAIEVSRRLRDHVRRMEGAT